MTASPGTSVALALDSKYFYSSYLLLGQRNAAAQVDLAGLGRVPVSAVVTLQSTGGIQFQHLGDETRKGGSQSTQDNLSSGVSLFVLKYEHLCSRGGYILAAAIDEGVIHQVGPQIYRHPPSAEEEVFVDS